MININDLLDGHVTLEVERADRVYFNGWVPRLSHGVVCVGSSASIWASPSPSPLCWGRSPNALSSGSTNTPSNTAFRWCDSTLGNAGTSGQSSFAASVQWAMKWSSSPVRPREGHGLSAQQHQGSFEFTRDKPV